MTRERFSKQQRLTSSDIQALFAHGKKVGDKSVSLLYKKQSLPEGVTTGGRNKLGITIGTRVAKAAHVRNRVKRLFREVFRRNESLFPAPYHYFFLKRAMLQEPTYESIFQEVKKLVAHVK
jgi:ribonuclease P protein component